jgi:hypothetical protein
MRAIQGPDPRRVRAGSCCRERLGAAPATDSKGEAKAGTIRGCGVAQRRGVVGVRRGSRLRDLRVRARLIRGLVQLDVVHLREGWGRTKAQGACGSGECGGTWTWAR